MKVIEEGKLRFTFGDGWNIVEKWDKSRSYDEGIGKLKGEYEDAKRREIVKVGSKAVDIVGVHRDEIYLIEVKDYRAHPIETKKRQFEEIPLVIACKVRDTIAGLIGASKAGKEPWTAACARLLGEPNPRVYVVAWIEDPSLRVSEPITKKQIRQKARNDKLKQHLSWLTPYVMVTSQLDARLPDVEVQNLLGAGQR